MKRLLLSLLIILTPVLLFAQTYTRQDTLRGSNGRGRDWWDVLRYNLTVEFDTATQSIKGSNTITFKLISQPQDSLQIDLQDGMFLDNVVYQGQSTDFANRSLKFLKDGNVFWVDCSDLKWQLDDEVTLDLYYHGRPHGAKNPPWDGGFIWSKDSLGNPWYAVACQGYGASCWWPCKDYQGDEPDLGMKIDLQDQPKGTFAVTNGDFSPSNSDMDVSGSPDDRADGSYYNGRSSLAFIKNPINTYNATFYIGDYAHWHDTIKGENGKLDLDFYPLKYNEERARKQFAVAKQMLHCFEYWMGPYPFYEDGYKLVEAPYLGMEHQSAIAYGNKYQMGYLGTDRSKTGIGMLFDYIIVHESGHEWFGNSITAKDIADNWIHEGFTTYTETLFTEWITNKDSAYQYMRGEWENIQNDRPVIGDYGVNDEGSGDKYDKGAAVVHMIRNIMNDDVKFRQLLRGLNKDFYHKIVTTTEVENYISKAVGKDLKPLFDQYLRTANIPVLEYYVTRKKVHYRFANANPAFSLPITASSSDRSVNLNITREWQAVKWKEAPDQLAFSKDFLYQLQYRQP